MSHKKRWDKQTIVDEAELVRNYALKNKKEIRRAELLLSKFKKIAKELNKDAETKNSDAAKNFVQKLKDKGFLSQDAQTLDEVLDISIRNILERRLSNIVYKLKLARTPKQARQFVVHRHVKVAENVVTAPSFLTSLAEEQMIAFNDISALVDENHPERKLEVEGFDDIQKDMKKTPLNKKEGPNFDKKEAILDDEELDEVDN